MLKAALIAGLTPRDFWDMTLNEVWLLFDARREEREAGMWETAWLASVLLQPHVKEGSDITPARLLGKPEPKKKRKPSAPIPFNLPPAERDKRVLKARAKVEIEEQAKEFWHGESIPKAALDGL